MDITRIRLRGFKRTSDVSIELAPINILVGGNNSGKSSVLEGIHFSVVASVAARLANTKTFTQDSLLFCPTKEFVNLRHGAPYRNQSAFGFLDIYASEGLEQSECRIKIYRGRNEGNVGCDVSGSVPLRQLVSSTRPPFSIYVPGLSGIPQVEECRTESIIRRGVASGDANLYLRNVLLLIKQQGKLAQLKSAVRAVFRQFDLAVEFSPETDLHISVHVFLEGRSGRSTPLELVGTGVQQALQIFSYVVLFEPYLLLLDEPDSHLHPDNQGLLSKALLTITATGNTKIIISTHSRHLVDSLYDESNIIWLKDGAIHEQGETIGRLPLLMDLGALDSFEKIREGEVDWVFLTEDASLELVKILIRNSGFTDEEIVTYSYKSSSNIQSAIILAEFIQEIAADTKVIIHRDRDFMTENEIEWISEKIIESGAIPFITEGSDIEYYFQVSEHLAELLGVTVDQVDAWKSQIARDSHNELIRKFLRKRDEVKPLYRNRGDNPPDSALMLGNQFPLPEERRLGKYMLRKLRASMHDQFGAEVDVTADTDYLWSEALWQLHEDHIDD